MYGGEGFKEMDVEEAGEQALKAKEKCGNRVQGTRTLEERFMYK
jgi:hypothetical protein